MKRFVILFLSAIICVALCGCENKGERESSKATEIDRNSADFDAGFHAGVDAVLDWPSHYGLISEENAFDYVVEHYAD